MRTDKENYNVVDINSRKKSETKQTTCGETPAAGASDENVEQTAELSEQDILDLYAGEMKVETPDLWDRIVTGIDEGEARKTTDKSVRTSRFFGKKSICSGNNHCSVDNNLRDRGSAYGRQIKEQKAYI